MDNNYFLWELQVEQLDTTMAIVDNPSAIADANNTGYASIAKFIELQFHYIWDHVGQTTVA